MVITHGTRGLEHANQLLTSQKPKPFSGKGSEEFFMLRIFASYLLLWPLCVPTIPQLMRRFFASKDDRSLKQSIVFHPLTCGILCIVPVVINTWRYLTLSDLTGHTADQITPMMLNHYSPEWLNRFVMVTTHAVFMSTLDSQLLTLSSMVNRDVYCRYGRRNASLNEQVHVG